MYSKAKVMGHPVHPLLITFPVAFYTVSFVWYVIYQFVDGGLFNFQIAYGANVAGAIMAVVAAIPGFIDWAFGIPRRTGAKLHGLIHMSLNVLALVLFALNAVLYRGIWETGTSNVGFAIVLTGIGVIATSVAGTYGWMLVSRHKVGVELTPEQERIEPVESLAPRTVRSKHESSHIPI